MKIKVTTGASITEKYLRIAEVGFEGKKISILRLIEFVLPEIPEKGFQKDKKFISDIRNEIRKLKIRTSLFVSPDDRNIILKEKVLPPIKKQEIFKLIESEIKDYAIFGHENVSLGFNTIKKEKDKTTIIWAGLKESILMNMLSFVKHLGLRSRAVIPSSFATAKFITEFYGQEKNFVIINVDSSVTTLTFVNGGKVVLNYKHDTGYSDIIGGDLAIRNNWVGNILTTITFVSRNRKIPIEKIFLISQEGKAENLLPFITSRITYPVIIPDLKNLLDFNDEESFLKVQETGGTEFIVPIGLALLQDKGQNDPLFCDISKHILVEKASVRVKLAVTVFLLILVNGLAVYFYPMLSTTLQNLSKNLNDTNKRIELVSKEAEKTEQIKNELVSVREELTAYKTAVNDFQNSVVSSALLAELKSKLPEDVELSAVSVSEGGEISITGVGKGYKNVLDYEINLASAKYVKNASILKMFRTSQNVVMFTMSAKVKENEKK